MNERELLARIASLEAATAKLKEWTQAIAEAGHACAEVSVSLEEKVVVIAGAMQELALGCVSLAERLQRIEDRLGMEP